jgi:hypothetical protein
LLIWVSLFLAPGAILGRIKEGGDVNNLSLCVYFLLAAMAVELRAALSRKITDKTNSTAPIGMLALMLIGLCTLYYLPTLTRLPPFARQLYRNPQQIAYDYLKDHPGEVYFPNDPLPALMANGKLYHLAEGIHDRERAGYPLSEEHLRSGIPPNMKWIAILPGLPDVKYFPAYHKPIPVPDLPDWKVLGKS